MLQYDIRARSFVVVPEATTPCLQPHQSRWAKLRHVTCKPSMNSSDNQFPRKLDSFVSLACYSTITNTHKCLCFFRKSGVEHRTQGVQVLPATQVPVRYSMCAMAQRDGSWQPAVVCDGNKKAIFGQNTNRQQESTSSSKWRSLPFRVCKDLMHLGPLVERLWPSSLLQQLQLVMRQYSHHSFLLLMD